AIVEAQSLLAREVAGALVHHPALVGWDLGNENSNVCMPRHRDEGLRWLEKIAGAIRREDTSHPITVGLHAEDLEEDRRLGPYEVGRTLDFASIHGYPMYLSWARGPADAMTLPFLGLITRWLSGKEVLFQEFGAPAVPRVDEKMRKQSRVHLLD